MLLPFSMFCGPVEAPFLWWKALCRIKKPRGYYLNDLSLLVLDESGQLLGAALGGAKRDVSCSVLLEPQKEYRVIPEARHMAGSGGIGCVLHPF